MDDGSTHSGGDDRSREFDRLLQAAAAGDDVARGRLWEIVVDDLRGLARRRLSRERRIQTELQATSLVNEVFLRLHRGDEPPAFDGREHFFGSVRRLMDQILCDQGRRRGRLRHGAGWERRPLELVQGSLAMLDRWLDHDAGDIWEAFERLHALNRDAAEVAWQHLVLGRSLAEIDRTIDDLDVRAAWRFAKASLQRDLRTATPSASPA